MMRAYLLDDERYMLNLLELQLLELQVEVAGRSSNPLEALEQIAELRPDIVFLDIEMPGMSGLEVAEALQARHADIRIVYVTAFSTYAVKAFEQHALDYLLKPVEEERLLKTVQRFRSMSAPALHPAVHSTMHSEVHSAEFSKELSHQGTAAFLPASDEQMQAQTQLHTQVQAQPEVQPQPQPQPQVQAQSSDGRLHIRALGEFVVRNGSGQEIKWFTAKAKELFALLLVHSEKGMLRDEIIETLWEQEEYGKSKIYLHACVSYIRKELRQHGYVEVLLFHNGKYCLHLEQIESDYLTLRTEMEKNAQWISQDTSIPLMEQLLAADQGRLFGDCDYPWARGEAERLRRQFMNVRLALSQAYMSSGFARKSVDAVLPLLTECPYEEEVYTQLIQAYQALGLKREMKRISQLWREYSAP